MRTTIIIIIFLIFISCNKKIATIDFEQVQDLEINVKDDILTKVEFSEYYENDTNQYLFIKSQENLYIYDFKNNKIISYLTFPLLLKTYCIISLDSILICLDNDYKPDSAIFLIDYKGNIKKFYRLSNLPIYNIIADTNKKIYHSVIANVKTYYYNDNVTFILYKYLFNDLYDSLYKKQWIPFSFSLNVKNNKIKLDSINYYPDLDPKLKYPLSYSLFNYYLENDKVFYTFPYTPKIIFYNRKNKNSRIISIKSYINNKIDSLSFVDDNEWGINTDYYLGMTKIEKMNIYFRFVKHSNGLTTVILLDKNLKIIGEAVYPAKLAPYFVIGDTIYIFNKTKTYQTTRKIFFSAYKMNVKKIKRQEFVNKNKKTLNIEKDFCNFYNLDSNNILKDNLLSIIQNKIQKKNYTAILIPYSCSCHSCVDKILYFYSLNLPLMKQKNVYAIVIDDNKNYVKDKIFSYKLSPNDVIIDTAFNAYKKCFRNFYLEHLIIVRENKIVFAKSYLANEIDNLCLKVMQ